MAIYFFDSSALVKRYVVETGTAWVCALTDPVSGNAIYVARLTEVETVAAVTRRARRGDISQSDAADIIFDVKYDFAGEYRVISIADMLVAVAVSMAEKHGLRAYDAVQLSVASRVNAECLAMNLPPLIFVCADAALNQAARAERLVVDDPNLH